MRRLAGELGVPAMTLYSHLPGKGELVDLMLDAVLGELYPTSRPPTTGNWRARVEAVARANRQFLLRHPGRSRPHPSRPAPNPACGSTRSNWPVDGMGASEVQMDLLVTLLDGFVRGAIGGPLPRLARTMIVDAYAQQVLDPDRFPTAARVASAAERRCRTATPRAVFEFGLERLLDGIGILMLNPSR